MKENEKVMSVQDKIMDKVVEEMSVLMQFAVQTGIPNDIQSKYSSGTLDWSPLKTGIILSSEEYNTEKQEIDEETVTLTFDKQKQLITVVRRIENQNNIETVGDAPLTNYKQYRRDVKQIVTEFKLNNGSLDVTTASIFQSVKEDTMGGGDWIIVSFNSINDFENKDHMSFTGCVSEYSMNKESYAVPEGYQLQDGLESIIPTCKELKRKYLR